MYRKVLCVLFLIFLSVSGFSQRLNKIGKIEVDIIPTLKPYQIESKNNNHKIYYDSLILEGNTWYDIQNGFLTTLEFTNNEKDKIFCYDSDGKLKATILTERVINLKVSETGNLIAWYNGDKIIKFNVNTFAIDTLQGSFVYALINHDKFIYYNPGQKIIDFVGQNFSLDEFPLQLVEFDSKILVCTNNYIYELKDKGLETVYEFKGTFFDLRIVDNELFFVEKREKRKETVFRLFKTADLKQFYLTDKLEME
ncbi:MAG: hypothetical protein ACLFVR_06545 [Thiohalospira sp.]